MSFDFAPDSYTASANVALASLFRLLLLSRSGRRR